MAAPEKTETAVHAPEPWRLEGSELIEIGDGPDLLHKVVRDSSDRWTALVEIEDAEGDANAARIVACVNAFAGVSNPEATMLLIRKALSVAEQYLGKAVADGALAGTAVPVERALALVTGAVEAAKARGVRW